jgi:Family of unknown function (DUF5329)
MTCPSSRARARRRASGPARRFLALACAAALAALASAACADVPDAQRSEIRHLFDYVRSSGCPIERNGKPYPASEAVRHMQKKYEYFRADIDSTEKFVELAASRSEASGKPYLVKCPGRPRVPARDWLLVELARYRAERR